MDNFCAERVREASGYIIKNYINYKADTAIVLGSGFGGFESALEDSFGINYSEIPGFPLPTAPGHAGRLVFGSLGSKRMICLSGRFHYYEGLDLPELVFYVPVLKELGVSTLILTNAAGAINESYSPGDVMIIKDHIKLMGHSPLRGRNDPALGERFPDMSAVYDRDLRSIAAECAKNAGITAHEGVYFYFEGPQFETPAEIRAARILGGDAAGMSTAPEAIAAAYCGMRVLGISLMSNMAAGVLDKPVTADEVNEAAAKAAPKLRRFMGELAGRI